MIKHEYTQLDKAIEQILEKQKRTINQAIRIQDIFVSARDPRLSYGESLFNENKYLSKPAYQRLVDLIRILAKLTNNEHIRQCCESDNGTIKIKKECLNTLTRLLLTEFSLYTRDPLTMKEFNVLCKDILSIAEKQFENVHLLLSTFSVTTQKDQILNIALYVQCGKDAKIQVITKANASDVDIKYSGKTLFSQQSIRYKQQLGQNVSEFIFAKEGQGISHQAVFEVTTLGGAKYFQAIDICRDHYHKRAKQLLEITLKSSNNTGLLPEQCDHILTSNSTPVLENNTITLKIMHADPSALDDIPTDKLFSCIPKVDPEKAYPELKLKKIKDHFVLVNPPFGSDLEIVFRRVRKLATLHPDLKVKVEQFNQDHIKNRKSVLMNDFIHIETPPHADIFFSVKGKKLQPYTRGSGYIGMIEKSIAIEQCSNSVLKKM